MLAVSILGISDNFKENIDKLDKMNIDFFHIDVMDGEFVCNKTRDVAELINLSKTSTKKDVHLMVNDVLGYVDMYLCLNPEYITFHYEAVSNHLDIINYIKSKNVKVGISISPQTSIDEIKFLLPFIDLVLVMTVEPGKGGQKFMDSMSLKVDDLYKIRQDNDFKYIISVDGGINCDTKKSVKNADLFVVGSYITSSDYQERIDCFKVS